MSPIVPVSTRQFIQVTSIEYPKRRGRGVPHTARHVDPGAPQARAWTLYGRLTGGSSGRFSFGMSRNIQTLTVLSIVVGVFAALTARLVALGDNVVLIPVGVMSAGYGA